MHTLSGDVWSDGKEKFDEADFKVPPASILLLITVFLKIPNHSKLRCRISWSNLRIIMVMTEIHANRKLPQDLGRVVFLPAKMF